MRRHEGLDPGAISDFFGRNNRERGLKFRAYVMVQLLPKGSKDPNNWVLGPKYQ